MTSKSELLSSASFRRAVINSIMMKRKIQVQAPVTTDWAGNICVNPQDNQGRMYVRPSCVEIVETKHIST